VAQKKDFLGQERQNELGLDWISFRYRNSDPALGRFMGIDPLAESFYVMTPYQFASNNPVWKIELEGLEGIRSQEFDANGNFKNHVVEKNIVVLVEKPVEVKKNWKDGKKRRKAAKNRRIANRNESRVNKVKKALGDEYSGAVNEEGESVKFNFNVTSLAVDDTSLSGMNGNDFRAMADGLGLTAGDGSISPAAIITTGKSSNGQAGKTDRNSKITFNTFSRNVINHEVGHTLLLRLPGREHSSTGLMAKMLKNITKLTQTEVSKMLEDSYEK